MRAVVLTLLLFLLQTCVIIQPTYYYGCEYPATCKVRGVDGLDGLWRGLHLRGDVGRW